MPRWRLTVEKVYNAEYWTNVYWLEATDRAQARARGQAIANIERSVLDTRCVLTKFRVDDGTPNTDEYSTVAINLPGTKDNSTSELMPLFVVARVDFTVDGGSPSRKYLRGVLTEADVQGPFTLINPKLDFLQNFYAAPTAGSAGFVDVDGELIDGGVVSSLVGMRQLRRGSKKKLTP